jgi:hypothetical protein
LRTIKSAGAALSSTKYNTKLVLTFPEPIVQQNGLSYPDQTATIGNNFDASPVALATSKFVISGGTTPPTVPAISYISADGKKVILYLSGPASADNNLNLTSLKGITGLSLSTNGTLSSISATADTTAPTVTAVSVTSAAASTFDALAASASIKQVMW